MLCSNTTSWNQAHCSVGCAQEHRRNEGNLYCAAEPGINVKSHAAYEAFHNNANLFTYFYTPLSRAAYNILRRGFFYPKPIANEDAHHNLRMRYLTASNVAAVIGANPYCSVKQIFKKYVLKEPGASNYFTRKGRDMEPFIAQKFVQATMLPCIYNQGLALSRRYPFLGASFDLLTHTGIPVEIKFLVSRTPKDGELVPFMYWVQCQVQMEVADASHCYYVEYKEASNDNAEYFSITKLHRDSRWFEGVAPQLEEFWDAVCKLRSGLSGRVSKSTALAAF